MLTADSEECMQYVGFKFPQESNTVSHKKWKGSMTLLQKFVLKLYTNVCNHRDGGLGFLALALMSVKCWR